MKTHHLKCWPEFYAQIMAGAKRHDLRRTDRDFEVGDEVHLHEFDPLRGEYTGRRISTEITYITSTSTPCAYSEIGLHPRFCILSYGGELVVQVD